MCAHRDVARWLRPVSRDDVTMMLARYAHSRDALGSGRFAVDRSRDPSARRTRRRDAPAVVGRERDKDEIGWVIDLPLGQRLGDGGGTRRGHRFLRARRAAGPRRRHAARERLLAVHHGALQDEEPRSGRAGRTATCLVLARRRRVAQARWLAAGLADRATEELAIANEPAALFALHLEGGRKPSITPRAPVPQLTVALRADDRHLLLELVEVPQCMPARKAEGNPVAECPAALLLDPVSPWLLTRLVARRHLGHCNQSSHSWHEVDTTPAQAGCNPSGRGLAPPWGVMDRWGRQTSAGRQTSTRQPVPTNRRLPSHHSRPHPAAGIGRWDR